MTTRNFSNTTTAGALTAPASPSATIVGVSGFANYPAVPFTATIERGTATEEIVLVTAVNSGNLTVTRGYNGTAATTHLAGGTVEHTAVALDFSEANAHVNATANVHGIVGGLVGDEAPQTLLDKTLVSPVVEADVTAGDAIVAWVPDGAQARNLFRGMDPAGDDVAVIASTGAATFLGVHSTGTAEVDGNTQLDGNLAVTGTSTFTGAVTIPVQSAASSPTRKSYVDAIDTRLIAAEATLTAATSGASNSTLVKRDASGNTAIDTVVLTDAPTAVNHATRKDYVDAIGTRVTTLETDGGWLSLTPAAGFSVGASGHARYRVKGGICYWSVYLAYGGTIGAAVNVVTFPVGARPTAQLAFPSSYSGVSTELTLATGGVLATVASTGASGIVAAGSFPVN